MQCFIKPTAAKGVKSISCKGLGKHLEEAETIEVNGLLIFESLAGMLQMQTEKL